MPAYAATAPAFAERRRHPRALILIIAGHAALIAAVMSAKMDLPETLGRTITEVELIEPEKLPPEQPPPPEPVRQANQSRVDVADPIVPLPPVPGPILDPIPMPVPNPGPIGPSLDPQPRPDPVAPVRTGPRFATPYSALKPPYPAGKLEREEEAVLRLRLAIDERGRVTAVDPVGSADPVFLAAARRHLIARWRYRPATEDGRAVASSTVITLRFELEG